MPLCDVAGSAESKTPTVPQAIEAMVGAMSCPAPEHEGEGVGPRERVSRPAPNPSPGASPRPNPPLPPKSLSPRRRPSPRQAQGGEEGRHSTICWLWLSFHSRARSRPCDWPWRSRHRLTSARPTNMKGRGETGVFPFALETNQLAARLPTTMKGAQVAGGAIYGSPLFDQRQQKRRNSPTSPIIFCLWDRVRKDQAISMIIVPNHTVFYLS
jgi:hypothetical protein